MYLIIMNWSFFQGDRKFFWLILFVGNILCFVPCMSSWEPDSIRGSSGLYHAMRTHSYALHFSLIFSMGLLCQILLDICAEINKNLCSSYNKSIKWMSTTQTLRLILVAVVFLPNLMILISSDGLKQSIFIYCFFQSTMIWILCLVADQINQFGQISANSKSLMLLLSTLFSTVAIVMLSWTLYGGANGKWYFLAFVISASISIFFAAMILVPWIRSLPAKPFFAFGSAQLSCLLNVMWIVVLGTSLLAVNIAARIYPNDNVPYAALTVYMKTISMSMLLVAQRHAKQNRNVMRVAAETIACTQHLFVRLISHELRTPLNSVYMGLDMIRTEMVDKVCCADAFEVLDDVRKSCEFTEDILDDLLSGLKLEKGIMFLDKTSVSAFAFALDCVTPHYLPAMAADVTLALEPSRTELAKELKNVNSHADRKKLSQLMKNLVGNAIKFTPCGGSVTVTVRLAPVTGWRKISRSYKRVLRIDVTDTGQGMSQEEMLCAFSEKESELPSGGPRGGLWICKSIVDLHGGEISVSSEGKHRGCTFTVLLPACQGVDVSSLYKVTPTRDMSTSSHSSQSDLMTVTEVPPLVLRSIAVSKKFAQKVKSRLEAESFHSIPSVFLTDSYSCKVNLSNNTTSSGSSGGGEVGGVSGGGGGVVGCGSGDEKCSKDSYVCSSHIPLELYVPSPGQGQNTNSELSHHHHHCHHYRISPSPSPKQDHDVVSTHEHQHREHEHQQEHQQAEYPLKFKSKTSSFLVRPKLDYILKHRRVLVVDDSLMNRKMLCRLVAQRCEQVDAAEDGTVAVCLVKESLTNETPYDVILMDYQMPNMDGPTAAKIIRDMGYTGFIIGVTGNVLPADMDHFLQQGADKVLFKPIELPKLEFVLSDLMKK